MFAANPDVCRYYCHALFAAEAKQRDSVRQEISVLIKKYSPSSSADETKEAPSGTKRLQCLIQALYARRQSESETGFFDFGIKKKDKLAALEKLMAALQRTTMHVLTKNDLNVLNDGRTGRLLRRELLDSYQDTYNIIDDEDPEIIEYCLSRLGISISPHVLADVELNNL